MAIPWPATLPQYPRPSGYSEEFPDTTIRTSMADGVAKVRRRTSAGVFVLKCAYELDKSQVDTLKTFYVSITEGGTLQVDLPHPRTGDTTAVRFVGAPRISALNAVQFLAEITWEVLP